MIAPMTLLSAIGTLALERAARWRFVRRGDVPAWCAPIQDEIPDAVAFRISDVFPFFELFLPEAEAAWRQGKTRLDSPGFTQILPDGSELHLMGTALSIDGANFLLVTENERLFQEERNVLQRARELRFAHDALAREMEQKEVLAHCVVHDLRGPLSAVLGSLELLERRTVDDATAKLVGVAHRAAVRQSELISDVLATFSAQAQTDARAPDREPPWSDLSSVVTQVANLMDPTARARGVTIQTVFVDVVAGSSSLVFGSARAHEPQIGSVEVPADELRLFRVMNNLVENALRYSPVGGVVRIEVEWAGDFLTVRVEDDGPGVSPTIVPHLFNKFVRARDGTPGTGLGLYFCRITVEGWGGSIGYEERASGGSIFWFRLPRRGT